MTESLTSNPELENTAEPARPIERTDSNLVVRLTFLGFVVPIFFVVVTVVVVFLSFRLPAKVTRLRSNGRYLTCLY